MSLNCQLYPDKLRRFILQVTEKFRNVEIKQINLCSVGDVTRSLGHKTIGLVRLRRNLVLRTICKIFNSLIDTNHDLNLQPGFNHCLTNHHQGKENVAHV